MRFEYFFYICCHCNIQLTLHSPQKIHNEVFAQIFTSRLHGCVGGGILGCSDDPNPEPPTPVEPQATLTVGTVGTNSAEFVLKTANVTDFAYILSSDPAEVAPDPAIFFGTANVVTATDGDNKFTVRDLEAQSEYRLFVAFRSKDKFGEVITSETFTTGKYTQLLTIIETDAFDALKFHIEVPAGKTIAWAAIDFQQFLDMSIYGHIVPNYFRQPKEMVNVVTESQTIVFKGYAGTDNETGEEVFYPIGVGQPHLVIAAEVEDKGEVDEYKRPMWTPPFDYETYDEDNNGDIGPGPLADRVMKEYAFDYDKYWQTDYYSAYLTTVRPWERLDAQVIIEVEKKTTKTVTLTFTPDEKMYNYGVAYMDIATFESMTQQFGSEDFAVWYSVQYATAFTEPATVTFGADYPLVDGMTYRAIVVGAADPRQTSVSVQYYDFEVGKQTKPAPEVVVTGIKAPEGETESPWTVWFNVKCTSRDAVSGKYLNESTTKFLQQLNSGYTYDLLFSMYGQPFDDAVINMINSAEGLDLGFPVWEDTSSRLAVMITNDEDVSTTPTTNEKAVADMKSIPLPDAPRVESELFNTLKGEWTVTVDATAYYYKNNVEGWYPEVKTCKVVISDEPNYPATVPEEVYETYKNNKNPLTREEVDELFADFKASSTKFAKKVRGQNRVLCEGLDLGVNYYGDYTRYQSAWDLFISPSYGAARVSDDLFYDFGPKWFLQIDADGKITVPTDPNTIVPVSNEYGPIYMAGMTPDKDESGNDIFTYAFFKYFETSVSEDGNTITIEPYVDEKGNKYYPGLIAASDQSPTVYAATTSFKMTRGWTEPAPEPTALSKRTMVSLPAAPANGIEPRTRGLYRRTYMGGSEKSAPRIEASVAAYDPSAARARYAKAAQALPLNRR